MWIVKYVLNNKPLITFTDELLDINNLGTFKRTIQNQKFLFVDTQLISKAVPPPKMTVGTSL